MESSNPVSKIIQAVIYPSQVLITQELSLELTADANNVIFAPLPPNLDRDSIRVKAFGKGEIKLGGTGLKEEQLELVSEEKILALQQAYEALLLKKQTLNRTQETLTSQTAWLLSQRERLKQEVAVEFAYAKLTVTEIEAHFEGLFQEDQEILKQLHENKRLQTELALELQKLTRELEQFRHQGSLSELQAHVDFQVLAPGPLKFHLTYLIPGANWQSFYDARLITETKTLELSYHASVSQNTGVDWDDTQLILSTANPSLSAHLPKAKSWYVDFTAPGTSQIFDGTPSSGSLAVNFGIKKLQNIPCDGNAKKVPIAICHFPATIAYEAIPKLSEQTYIKVNAKNTEDYPFLSGKTAVYQDYNYVGESELTTVVPNSEFTLFMGVEEGIKVERQLLNRLSEIKGFGGNTARVTYKIRISVKSFKSETVTVEVLEPLPLSRNSEIKVKIDENQPAYTNLDEKNILHWELNLAPQEEAQIILDYYVEYPKEKRVVGLE